MSRALPRTHHHCVDRLEASTSTTLEDLLRRYSAAEVQTRSESRATAVAVVDADATGVLEMVRDPTGGWAVNAVTTCLR